ncbi:hypothetical protein BDP27DRAFT_1418712 [Rhodocollybia butyracea]|uniref:Uncharacterized protein n=1 Tax=Rhodocollybia butyracea TaxID=206335 RepID=A0A9P5Q0X3_9AGAR|nr:hypothetical protein BDP27DRAFT_1418712 [Rhodocollybia butyracea]
MTSYIDERRMFLLIDSSSAEEEAKGLCVSLGFPVQAVSPRPKCFKIWKKEKTPVVWGLPLWTRSEILLGLTIHNEYPGFRENLKRCINQKTLTYPENIQAAQVFLNSFNLQNQHHKTLDDCLEILVDNAIHAVDLMKEVALYYLRSTPYDSHYDPTRSKLPYLIALQPNTSSTYGIFASATFYSFDFKSLSIRNWVSKSLQTEPFATQVNLYYEIYYFPALKACCFEALAHTYTTQIGRTDSLWSMKLVDTRGNNEGDSNENIQVQAESGDSEDIFSTGDVPTLSDICMSPGATKKQVWSMENYHDGSEVDEDVYYMADSEAVTHSPFEGFFVENMAPGHTVLYILRITILLHVHKGSQKDDELIQLLMKLTGATELRYVLVYPLDRNNQLDWGKSRIFVDTRTLDSFPFTLAASG